MITEPVPVWSQDTPKACTSRQSARALSHHHQRQLYRIEAGLLGADPQLTAMLGLFGRLSEGQAMPSWEQVPTRRDRIRQAAALTVRAITLAAAATGLVLRAVLALVIAAAGPRRSRPLPAPGPARSRRGRGTGGHPGQAGHS